MKNCVFDGQNRYGRAAAAKSSGRLRTNVILNEVKNLFVRISYKSPLLAGCHTRFVASLLRMTLRLFIIHY